MLFSAFDLTVMMFVIVFSQKPSVSCVEEDEVDCIADPSKLNEVDSSILRVVGLVLKGLCVWMGLRMSKI